MEDKMVQVLGTFFFGGALLNWIFPICFAIFSTIGKHEAENNFFLLFGGKINRKWYLINSIVCTIILLVLSVIAYYLHNIIMYLILIPYFILNAAWYCGNTYKRLFAITDKSKFSLVFSIIFCVFCFVWQILKSEKIDIIPINCFSISVDILRLVIWFLLFVLPSKKID